MTSIEQINAISTPGQPWGEAEKARWRALQRVQRSHAQDVVSRVQALASRFDVVTYGELDCGPDGRYPLLALRSQDWDSALPVAVVTGGVHGYETSGVHGALQFAEQHAADYAGRLNLLLIPCVSPWGYERIQRWNAWTVDPNRSFMANSPAPEAAAVLALLDTLEQPVLVHIDLHETTDSDESEFRPALAARDGKPFEPGTIPDGFYLVSESERPAPGFQQAIITAVEAITHIAPADEKGEIIGDKVVAHGVICYPGRAIGLCGGMTDAPFVTTTEVYPDSPKATAQQCNDAQVAAVRAALDYALANG
ncbi:MAG: M14 family metallocarboxypeptidase [Stenotrophomonas sp.]